MRLLHEHRPVIPRGLSRSGRGRSITEPALDCRPLDEGQYSLRASDFPAAVEGWACPVRKLCPRGLLNTVGLIASSASSHLFGFLSGACRCTRLVHGFTRPPGIG